MPKKTYTNQEIIEYFVCGECGGKLSLITIEDEGELAHCRNCQKTHTGVMPEVYELAREYARLYWGKDYGYTMIPGDETFRRERRNIGDLCGIIKWLIHRLDKGGAQ
jgi:hypothetical protein